jgi:hypothetical protein
VSNRDAFSFRERVRIFGFLGLFAVLLALVTSKHEMYLDEVQPWLWVRYAPHLLPAIEHLRYESHPGLWVVLLFAASRISSNVIVMQCVNFLLATTAAWVILSTRSLPIAIRVLIIFGVSFFYTTGVLARDYMLAALLLIAATRCLLAQPQRQWLAMLLLALAINAHFLAIPVAASIFMWFYMFSPEMNLASFKAKVKGRGFRIALSLEAIALIACYFTVRPAKDMSMRLGSYGGSAFDYLVLGVGRIWHYYLPLNIDAGASIPTSTLPAVAYADVLVTMLLWFVALSVLPGKRSRYFMITASVLWTAAAIATVHVPLATHASFVIVCYIIALLVNRPEDRTGSWLPSHAAQPVLIVLLSAQVLICAEFCVNEWYKPFSAGKSVAEWLEQERLTAHPLVVQPELPAPVVMAYTGIPTVYFPACRCSRSFVLYSRGWDSDRSVTHEELQSLQSDTGKSPVVLSEWQISDDDQRQLGLHLAFISAKGWAFNNEDVFVYDSIVEPAAHASEAKR